MIIMMFLLQILDTIFLRVTKGSHIHDLVITVKCLNGIYLHN